LNRNKVYSVEQLTFFVLRQIVWQEKNEKLKSNNGLVFIFYVTFTRFDGKSNLPGIDRMHLLNP